MNNLETDYLDACSGAALYCAIKDLHDTQGVAGADEAKTFAGWIEKAIRRGITDSIYVSVAEVHLYLASLYQIAGDSKREAVAREAAEASLDGFRLVDRVEEQVRSSVANMDSATATRLIADLERAKHTKRLFEYPNYVGRLLRMKGELLEVLGCSHEAVEAYKAALEANPKAGCAKRLKLLSNGRVTPAMKPKPQPVEDRINLANLSMFHFRCPLCGSACKETSMRAYLKSWNGPVEGRFKAMLQMSSEVASMMSSRKTFQSKKFDDACPAFISAVKQNFGAPDLEEPFMSPSGENLWMHKDCPVCKQIAGARWQDNYFTRWSECCRVQGSNLFFEVGVICLALNRLSARWMNSDQVQISKKMASHAFRVCEAIGLSSCPRCGRFTNAIFGGSRAKPEAGMCRWCLDLTQRGQITIQVELERVD